VRPSAAGERNHYVSIEIDLLSGRRIVEAWRLEVGVTLAA
jgi:hypothetical protein